MSNNIQRVAELEAEVARLREVLSQVERHIDGRIVALEERNAAQAQVAELRELIGSWADSEDGNDTMKEICEYAKKNGLR